MDDSDSSLSSLPSSQDELDVPLTKGKGIQKYLKTKSVLKEQSPPRPKREPSPEHVYEFADNSELAFIVMFRSRFNDAIPKKVPTFGPQELERAILDVVPGELVECFLCALLGLLLNRKQDIKAGHYNRALEEAIQTHKSQWSKDWKQKSPLSGGVTFTSMSPTQRLTLLRTLILWALSSSEAIKGMITASYKQSRHEDDLNQPLSVQPWGSDGDRRRYFLIESLDDTHFRVYRESNYTGIKRTWWSVAGNIDELKGLAEKLEKDDGGQKARTLSNRITAALPRFETTEDKRKRREYRQVRKQQFRRPEPASSLYEGRTRGKRIRYTYSDEEDEGYSDTYGSRRSTHNTRNHTPTEPSGPTVTLSGRQVKSRHGGTYGETLLSGAQASNATAVGLDGAGDELDPEAVAGGRPRRAAADANHNVNGWAARGGKHIEGYNSVDEMDDSDEDDASEQDYGDDEEDYDVPLESDNDDDGDLTEEDDDMEDALGKPKKSLIAKLRLPAKMSSPERKITVMLNVSPGKSSNMSVMDTKENISPKALPNETEALEATPLKANGLISQSNSPPQSTIVLSKSPEKPATLPPSIDVGYVGS